MLMGRNHYKILKLCRAWRHSLRMISANCRPVFLQAQQEKYDDRLALVDNLGQHKYSDLLSRSATLARHLIVHARRDPGVSKRTSSGIILNEERIGFLCQNNASYVIAQWGSWMSGGVAVPLCKVHPSEELEYTLTDSDCSMVVSTEEYSDKVSPIARRLQIKHIVLDEESLRSESARNDGDEVPGPDRGLGESYLRVPDSDGDADGGVPPGVESEGVVDTQVLVQKWNQVMWRNRNAMIVYTSGTTGRPKGVVLTHGNVQAQTTSLLNSWGWSSRDVVLHSLPLHHSHGIINLLCCPLWMGATCVMLPSFDPEQVWEHLLSDEHPRINLFMTVPTVYAKLIEFYEEKFTTPKVQAFIKATCKQKIRLMVSGSAPLPQPFMERWEDLTGHKLLERYGMTELGMVLSNPLNGPRVPGSVGNPLPTVDVRITSKGQTLVRGNSSQSQVEEGCEGKSGELEVKGPSVFKKYWQREDATEEAFTPDGWFKTGDTARYDHGRYHIMGRTSIDIIKSGGYKISALDVERRILSHPSIAECVIVGLPDMTWGQRVAAVIVMRTDARSLDIRTLREWAKDKMPPYVIPTEIKVLPNITRNIMGKVNKKNLLKDVFGIEK